MKTTADYNMVNAYIPGRADIDPATEAMIARRNALLGPAYRLMYEHPLHIVRGTRMVGPVRLLSVFPCHHGAARLLSEAYEKTAACVSGAGQYDFSVILRGSRAGKAAVSTGGCL